MSTSFPIQGYHVVYMYPDVIFQIFPPCSRPMTSHHVICHVTAVSCASLLSKRKVKEKEKENQYKIRKIKERKIKLLVFKCSITERREGKRSVRLANTKGYQGYAEVLRISKLLSLIYQELCVHSQTIA